MARNHRDRFGYQSLHRDDGSGRCEYDFEEWPCAHSRLGLEASQAEGMSLQEWAAQGEREAREKRDNEWYAKVNTIISAAKMVGLEELADVLADELNSRGYSPYSRRMPEKLNNVPLDELVWLLHEAAAAGARYPFAPESDGVVS